MTREEAIELLVNATYSDEWQGNEDLTTAHDMAIEALKQEPILEQIRAEIEEQKKDRCFDDEDMFVYRTGLDDALYIIDKYKAESE